MQYDLEERLAQFGEKIIDFAKLVHSNNINKPLITQLIRSATSVGANYMEANQASSKKDFQNKICIAKKESNESKHWLRMLSKSDTEHLKQCRQLWKEAHEITLILATIYKKCQKKV